MICVLDNHSRAILASGLFRTQDLASFLSVLYRAVERYGSPGRLVTDSGSVFRATRAKAVYEVLGMEHEQIERGRPWQKYAETTFAIQERMADHHFGLAESWPELVGAHERWVHDYNHQDHWAHLGREDGRRSPMEVLGWLSEVRYRPEDLSVPSLKPLHPRPGRSRVRPLQALAPLRRGGAAEEGGHAVAGVRAPNARVPRATALALRCAARGRDRGAADRHAPEAVWRPRSSSLSPGSSGWTISAMGVDQGARVGRVRRTKIPGSGTLQQALFAYETAL